MRVKVFSILPIVLLAMLVLGLVTSITQADDHDMSHTGVITNRPTDIVGEWVIGDLSFEANNDTLIDEEHGSLELEACAKVDYISDGDKKVALKIESKEAMECDGGHDDEDGDDDNHLQVYGHLDSFPTGLIGEWVVDGVTYTADANTEFEQEHGPFAGGGCVEVKYLPGASLLALEIETEHEYKCSDDGPYTEIYGVLGSFPADLIGDWEVDGVIYTADAGTQFEQEHGPFFTGGCVEVKFLYATSQAIEISTEEPEECTGSDSEAEQKFYGFVEDIPNGWIGTWTIEGIEFVATAETEFEEDHGSFATGVCAEVEYYDEAGVNMAMEIETESPYHCNGVTATNEAYGLIDSFPDSLYGTWVIGSDNFVASVGVTEFEQEHGSFAEGACVKVKYYTDEGVNQAVEIETEEAEDCQGESLPTTSKVYATIDSFPPNPFIGPWGIGGTLYTATAATEFEQEHGPFAVDACVEAEYTVDNGQNLLHEVETEHTYKCQEDGSPLFKAYGVVESLPFDPDYIGTWTVSGTEYEADAGTELSEEHGFFAVGAFVEVKYIINGVQRLALEIETHVAPDAGLGTTIGKLESHDGNDDWSDWVIDGSTYKSDPVIEVNTGELAPQVGDWVAINVYEKTGTQFATSSTRLIPQGFLPAIAK